MSINVVPMNFIQLDLISQRHYLLPSSHIVPGSPTVLYNVLTFSSASNSSERHWVLNTHLTLSYILGEYNNGANLRLFKHIDSWTQKRKKIIKTQN